MVSKKSIVMLEDVTYTHPGASKPLFDRISLQIEEGEWVSVVGANGSGKSTLAKMLNGLIPHHRGRIVIDGMELTAETTDRVRQTVGIVFQNPENQFVGLTVADDIVFGLENRCLNRRTMQERLREYAGLLGVTGLLDKHPGELSGGQKQRAAIAAVLAAEPKIVVLDEAASMLDEQSKRSVLSMLQDMRRSGRYTVIAITHDIDEMTASDRIVAISDGTVIGDGPPGSMLLQERVLRKCRLRAPFALELCRELRRQGIPVTETIDDHELLEELWALHSRT